MHNTRTPMVLLILDGWGIAPQGPGNAFSQAHTPYLDLIMNTYPCTSLECSGPQVGLPRGQMGNSEVGHLNIGAGRIVYQDILRISLALEEGRLEQNPVLEDLLTRMDSKGTLHLMGLVSDGGVHSLQEHLHGLLDILGNKNVSRVMVHCFLDGRDTSPTSGAQFVARLQEYMHSCGTGRIATVMGRYYAMDRDKRWERTQEAYDALTLGQAEQVQDPVQAIQESYSRGITDEFVKPMVVTDKNNHPVGCLQDNDAVLFFNFRADRARQLTQALYRRDFQEFTRSKTPDLSVATMTEYDKSFGLPVLFPPENLQNILGEVLSENSITQLRIAETEKYAHVTYFFNGGREEPFPGEERILMPSPREVPTYDHKPEMSAYEVTEKLCSLIRQDQYSLYVCNLANLDMVGHTGNIHAAVRACEAVDRCAGSILEAVLEKSGVLLLTSDHGNSEDMLAEDGSPKTAHSTNPVHLCLVNCPEHELRREGILADIAPTILDLWSIDLPHEMNGKSLLYKEK